MIYINLLKDKPFYVSIIVFSLILGATYYAITNHNEDVKDKIIFFTSGALSIISSLIICSFVSLLFNKKSGYRSFFSIFYAFSTFPIYTLILSKALNYEPNYSSFLPSILLAISFARIACIFEGCCNGKIGAVYIEIVTCLSLFAYDLIKKNLKFPVFYFIYAAWRFLADFFKETYLFEKIGPFSPTQYISIIILGLTIALSIRLNKEKNYEK